MRRTLVVIVFFVFCQNIGYSQAERHRKLFDKGTILSSPVGLFDDVTYDITLEPYDNFIVGVATGASNPKAVDEFVGTEGVLEVKYNYENGSISKGDLVTSSSQAGVAMKATQSGIILGVALESTNSPSGLVEVRVLIQYITF